MVNTYQIRNVLRVHGNQLKRRSVLNNDNKGTVPQVADYVDISIEAKRKQMVSRMSNHLISQIHSKNQDYRPEERLEPHHHKQDPDNGKILIKN